jgi:hypothetical protein
MKRSIKKYSINRTQLSPLTMFVKDLQNSECQKPSEGAYPLEGILRVSTLELAYVIKIRGTVKRRELTDLKRHSQCPDSH